MITINNAYIFFTNFSGRPTQVNPAGGKRTFCVILPPDFNIDQMVQDGWNIKYTKPNDPEQQPAPFVEVVVNYNARFKPAIYLVNSRCKRLLNEDTIDLLDSSRIKHVDVEINPSHWQNPSGQGIKGYVTTMYAVVQEDSFANIYGDLPEG